MSEEKKIESLADETMEAVSGGMSVNLMAAYRVNKGLYGSGDDCVQKLKKAGFNPDTVLRLADALNKYEDVANAVIRGNYVNGAARVNALTAAGYDADEVQFLVNNMRWDPKTGTFK